LSELVPQNQEQHYSRDDWSTSDGTEVKGDKGSSDVAGGRADHRKQHQAISDLVQILSRVLGDQWQEIMGKLKERVTSLSESNVQSLAECMADVALIKAELKFPQHNEGTHHVLQELLS
jgi:hypothetical protein